MTKMKTTEPKKSKKDQIQEVKSNKKYSRNPLEIKYGFHVHKKKRIEPMGVLGKEEIGKVAVGNGEDGVGQLGETGN